jgi:hypothetical protein
VQEFAGVEQQTPAQHKHLKTKALLRVAVGVKGFLRFAVACVFVLLLLLFYLLTPSPLLLKTKNK